MGIISNNEHNDTIFEEIQNRMMKIWSIIPSNLLTTFLIRCILIPYDWWLHCLEYFPTASFRKWNFGFEKGFDEARAYNYDTKVSLTGQKGWAWVQLLPQQKLSNSEIVCHLAERDNVQNSVKNHKNV